MSYNDQYNEGGSRQGDNGGNDSYGRSQGGYGGEDRRGGGNDTYGGNQGGYGGGEERRHGNQGGNQGGNYGVTGGAEYNTGGGSGYGNQSGGGYGNTSGQGRQHNEDSDEFQGALHHSKQESGGQDTSIFSTALGFLSNNKQDIKNSAPDFDESQATKAHEQVYGSGDNQQHGAQTLGMSAAMQAMQKFTGGGAPQQAPQPQKEEGGLGGLIGGFMGGEKKQQPPPVPAGLGGMISSVMGGNQGSQQGQNQFIGLAMKEASDLFNKQEAQGNVVSTTPSL